MSLLLYFMSNSSCKAFIQILKNKGLYPFHTHQKLSFRDMKVTNFLKKTLHKIVFQI